MDWHSTISLRLWYIIMMLFLHIYQLIGKEESTIITQSFEHVLFDNALPVKIIVQRTNHFNLHWHQYPELLYVVKGSILLHIDSEDYILREGNFMYISDKEPHSVNRTDEDNMLISVQFDAEFFKLLPELKTCFFRRSAFMQSQTVDSALFPEMKNVIANMVYEYNKHPKGYRYMVASHVYFILAQLIRNDFFTEKPMHTKSEEYSYQRISHVLEYINAHYTDDLSLHAIADEQHISYYHLSRVFKEVAGVTFREYVTNVRLHNSTKALKNTKDSVLTIALTHGFSSAKGYTAAFKERYGVKPGEYRRHFLTAANGESTAYDYAFGNENNLFYLSVNASTDLSYIYSLISPSRLASPTLDVRYEEHEIQADLRTPGKPLPHSWSVLCSCGRASDLMRSAVQGQVARAQKELGYQYIRFHGIFGDEMMIYNHKVDGTIVYNWLYLDQIFDFLQSVHLKPFLELDFTPSELSSSNNFLFWYKANISKPNNLDAWAELVRALLRHCIARYGIAEVSTWYVEVWNEPDYQNVFWEGTMEDYFQLYEASAKAVKAVCPAIKVGGPAITHIHYRDTPWIRDFLSFATQKKLPVDFISYHIYADLSSNYSSKGTGVFPQMSSTVHFEENMECDLISVHSRTMKASGRNVPECHATEWNISAKARFTLRDTTFMAPYIIKTALACRDHIRSLSYWTITDLIEELKAPLEPFHGGLGLINMQGVPKPSFWAFFMLNKLGDTVLQEGDGYILTRRYNCYQLLLYNFANLDQLTQLNAVLSTAKEDNLYFLFEEKPSRHFSISFSCPDGQYRIMRYELNRKYGSAYDIWLNMGANAQLTADETAYLRAAAIPRISSDVLQSVKGRLAFEGFVPIHGCQLIVVHPVLED